MNAHVLLNLLIELGKRDKMRGLPSILSLFHNELDKFNNTRAQMLDSIYHMTNTLKSHFWRKNIMILSLCTQRFYGRQNVSPFYCMALFHSLTRRHMIKIVYLSKNNNSTLYEFCIIWEFSMRAEQYLSLCFRTAESSMRIYLVKYI